MLKTSRAHHRVIVPVLQGPSGQPTWLPYQPHFLPVLSLAPITESPLSVALSCPPEEARGYTQTGPLLFWGITARLKKKKKKEQATNADLEFQTLRSFHSDKTVPQESRGFLSAGGLEETAGSVQ